METTTHSVEQTEAFGRRFAEGLDVGDCVALVGDLGAGKTALARGLAVGLGLDDPRMVSSPTFVLVQEYPGRVPIFHLDLYRLSGGAEELMDLGFEEMLADGVVLIEWAQRAQEALPRPYWLIEIGIEGPQSRRFEIRRMEE